MSNLKCLMCEKDVDGERVANTQIIQALRQFKRRFPFVYGPPQNNVIVVCPSCMENYSAKRKNFERRVAFIGVCAAIVVVILVFMPLLFGAPFNFSSLIVGPILGALILSLALINYVPSLEKPQEAGAANTAVPAMQIAPGKASQAKAAKKPQKAAAKNAKRSRKR